MPRHRSYRGEEIVQDEAFNRVSFGAQVFYFRLGSWLSDKGRIAYQPKTIAGILYPLSDEVGAKEVKEWVAEWEAVGRLQVYEVDGKTYLWASNFLNEQRIPNPGKCKLPPHPDDPEAHQPALFESEEGEDVDPNETLRTVNVESTQSERRGNVEGEESERRVYASRTHGRSSGIKENWNNSNSPPYPPPDWFEKWWADFDCAYPARGGGPEERPQARGLLLAMTGAEADFEAILAGCKRFRAYTDHKGKTGGDEGVPSMLNWVKGERWREAYNFKNGKHPASKPDHIEHRKEPKEGLDFYLGRLRVPVDQDGNECDEGAFEFAKYDDIPAKLWIRDGERTEERFSLEEWKRGRGQAA